MTAVIEHQPGGTYYTGCRCFECKNTRRIEKALRRLARGMNMHVDTGELCGGCRDHLYRKLLGR